MHEAMQSEERRWKSGSANRGKKFNQERINKMHENRSSESYSHSHTFETKNKIGELSKAKFTKEFSDKLRKTMEERGYWVPLDQKSDFEVYYLAANWKERMWDKTSNKDQILLLEKLGVFNCKTNTKGVVRDHIFGRLSGFELGIFPEILRHPCNCQIITHSDNVRKKKNRYIDRNDLTLDELFGMINSYDQEWLEQKLCIQLIREYKKGKRWKRKE
jgi:hypothetical protein